jgi:uncharacterized OsmC-like protein
VRLLLGASRWPAAWFRPTHPRVLILFGLARTKGGLSARCPALADLQEQLGLRSSVVGPVVLQTVSMAEDVARQVTLVRVGLGRYEVRNVRGGSITIGSGGDGEFTPVELLLAALGGCTAIDVDLLTARRAEPESFQVTVTGDKVRDEGGNRMTNLAVRFAVGLPDGPAGDAARAVLPVAAAASHDRLCTVSRTVEAGTPVSIDVT